MSTKDKLSVKSSGEIIKDEKSKAQQKELQAMKKKAAEDEKKAKEKQQDSKATLEKERKAKDAELKKENAAYEKRKKESAAKEEKFDKTVSTAGAAIAASALKGLSSKNGKKRGIQLLVVLAVCAIAYLLLGNQIKHMLGISDGNSILPPAISDLFPDSVMGYNHIDFENAILGETREKEELVVLEQDIKVDSEISNALANISLFKKTKIIHSYGTGVYTVNMEHIDKEHIQVDDNDKKVTVEIPRAVLQYVNLDVNKTEFEDTDRALLGFGDIKMTHEQQKILSRSIDEAMRKELDTTKMYALADETAALKVREIFQPLISSVSDQYIVEVIQK